MPNIRKPRMYLNNRRKCCKCGSNKTNDKLINKILWHRDIDDNGKWTGNWNCDKCYQKEYCKKRREENNLMREELIKRRCKNGKDA